MTKKLIIIHLLAAIVLVCFATAPAYASEVTGTLSSDASSGGSSTSGTVGGSVGGTGGGLTGTVVGGATRSGGGGGGGGGGGSSGSVLGASDTSGGGGTTVVATPTPLVGQVLGASNVIAQAPGLPNTGEGPSTTSAPDNGWMILLATAICAYLAVVAVASRNISRKLF